MDVFLLISIILWIIIGIGALISDHKSIIGIGVIVVSLLYLIKVSHGHNDLMAFIAVFLLWLSLSLLSLAWSLRGINRKEVESACSFTSLGYLPILTVLPLKYGAIAFIGIFLWFGLWYGFRMVYHQEKTVIVLVHLPAVLMAALFRTLLAIPYGILLWWLYEDVKKLWRMCESAREAKTG
ncbi:hypothetical protein FH039_04900 [Thermococcus indicus]|uniref:Uncharacterized protein n=1 Tax=Thermococcus indicus TaxID=2586643 RepID=A0A4Y5SJV8_9EURY|nr:hypothetical protein [Thermococcus indicus]QDA31075.1 hypothetical protein FH039_04900 [Thermococcus indicus]